MPISPITQSLPVAIVRFPFLLAGVPALRIHVRVPLGADGGAQVPAVRGVGVLVLALRALLGAGVHALLGRVLALTLAAVCESRPDASVPLRVVEASPARLCVPVLLGFLPSPGVRVPLTLGAPVRAFLLQFSTIELVLARNVHVQCAPGVLALLVLPQDALFQCVQTVRVPDARLLAFTVVLTPVSGAPLRVCEPLPVCGDFLAP